MSDISPTDLRAVILFEASEISIQYRNFSRVRYVKEGYRDDAERLGDAVGFYGYLKMNRTRQTLK